MPAVEGQGSVARCHGEGPCGVRWLCRVMPSQVVPEAVGDGVEEAGVAGGGGLPPRSRAERGGGG